MAESTSPSPPAFLRTVLQHCSTPSPSTRPHVTLTFAQSLDAKIAGAGGRQLILSGKESMIMTHWMRTMHDVILIGINTALNDDPQLNVRHLPLPPPSTPYSFPRPVIVDTHLRLPPTCKLLRNFQSNTGRKPWVLCSPSLDPGFLARRRCLELAGAEIKEISPSFSSDTITGIPIVSILRNLRELGVNSLMVEGGAHIIGSFLAESVVDALVITVAPVLVGEAGVGYRYPTSVSEDGGIVPKFKLVHTEALGIDTVLSLKSIS